MDENLIIQTSNFQLTQIEFLIRMLVAIGIGFVIGLEREFSSKLQKEGSFAGVRTFVFVVLLGFLSAFLSQYFTHWILLGGLLSLVVIVYVSYTVSAKQGSIGSTTEVATFLAFFLGCTTLLGFIEVSLAFTVVVLVMLSLKVKLQGFVGQINQEEMVAFVKFVVLALLIFPFLPDTDYGAFNPRELGWVVLLTSALGFVGYLMMKFIGRNHGILLTGIIGGLVSSTVVTWIFSKKSKVAPKLSGSCAVAILAASTIMVVRVFVWIIIFNRTILPSLMGPLFLVFIAGLGVSVYYYNMLKDLKDDSTEIPLGEPLNLKEALFFGLLYSAVLLLVGFAHDQFGDSGIYFSSAIAALTDIDAITISMAKLGGNSVQLLTAQNAILLATLCNTIVKIGIALWAGSKELRKYVLIGYSIIFLAGIVGFIWLNM